MSNSTVLKTREMHFIASVVAVAYDVGIENLIIEKDKVRGKDPDDMVLLIHTDGHPTDLTFERLGFNTQKFNQRYSVVRDLNASISITQADFNVDGKQFTYVRSMQMKASGVSIDFRCANPVSIKRVPAVIADEVAFEFPLSQEFITAIGQAKQTMASELITISHINNAIAVKSQDINSDEFVKIIESDIDPNITDDVVDSFDFDYKTDLLIKLAKKATGNSVQITRHGMLKFNINGFDVYLKPSAE